MALIVLAYLLVLPSFLVLRVRERDLERPFRAPGGMVGALTWTVLATGWALAASVFQLWPGLGTAEPDRALPPAFAGDRARFELLVVLPLAGVIALASAFYAWGRREQRSTPAAFAAAVGPASHDPARLVAPVAVAQEALVELAGGEPW